MSAARSEIFGIVAMPVDRSLARVGGQLRADVGEGRIDLARDAAHSRGCGERNQRHDQRVLDQILPADDSPERSRRVMLQLPHHRKHTIPPHARLFQFAVPAAFHEL